MDNIDEAELAVAVREDAGLPQTTEQKHTLTPAQARVEAVSNVLHKAYEKASTLQLTPDEIGKLKADFPDEAFKLGAGGNPELIYIEFAYLRDRFDEAIGMGQWSLVRSRPHWAEEFTTQKGQKATRIYADCALLVRGCLVSEAIGDMVYYPNNATQSYGDAAEGSETAAFRRCAKKLGVGLQAWKKDFCAGWMERHRAASRAPLRQQATHPASTLPERIKKLRAALGAREEYAVGYLRSFTVEGSDANSALLPNEGLDGLRDEQVEWLSRNWPDFLRRLKEYIESVTDDLPMVPVEAVAPQRDAQAELDSNEPPGGWQGAMGSKADPDEPIGPTELQITGYVKVTTKKETKKAGKFRYGVCVSPDMGSNGIWLNTFSDSDYALASGIKGNKVACTYSEGKYGKELLTIQEVA